MCQHSGMLTWTEVAALLAPWRNYWLSTLATDGSPQVSPIWGVLVDETFYFYTETGTAKYRNVLADPRVAVHLESGDDVVIVRGTVELIGSTAEHPELCEAYVPKYTQARDRQYLPADVEGDNVLFALHPMRAVVWLLVDYEGSIRRWAAEPATVSDPSS